MVKMEFVNWWKEKKYWLRGGIIGLVIGLTYIPFGLGVGSHRNDLFILKIIYKSWLKLFEIFLNFFCFIFSIPQGENCAFSALFFSFIIFPLIGLVIGLIIGILIGNAKK